MLTAWRRQVVAAWSRRKGSMADRSWQAALCTRTALTSLRRSLHETPCESALGRAMMLTTPSAWRGIAQVIAVGGAIEVEGFSHAATVRDECALGTTGSYKRRRLSRTMRRRKRRSLPVSCVGAWCSEARLRHDWYHSGCRTAKCGRGGVRGGRRAGCAHTPRNDRPQQNRRAAHAPRRSPCWLFAS